MTYTIFQDIADILPTMLYSPIIFVLILFLYFRVGAFAWLTLTGLTTIFYSISLENEYASQFFTLFLLLFFLILKPIRQLIVTRPLVWLMKKIKMVPKISETEKTALLSGTAWMDKELFSGSPSIEKLRNVRPVLLTAEEKKFLNTHVEKVCEITNDWKVFQSRDLGTPVWNYLKKNKFFGLIIPKKYGGLEFSATAHAAVIEKLASRCYPLSVTVMVPNSLGPAELLLHYGTEAQRSYYLPRLARGEEIPCFGLTEPTAGSDAGSMQSEGIVSKNKKGEIVITLNFRKRYITLAAISTVIGLAFQLKDPKELLGKGKDPGITCALIPAKTKGITLGRRHDPLNVPFYNCPVEGKNVVIGLKAIIGEAEGVGEGWKMLMESLAAGRGISLPSTATGTCKLVSSAAGNYAVVRQQFNNPLYNFEGVQEPLSRIAGFTYLLNAAKTYTLSALDSGERPPVVSAICKYHFTEIGRQVTDDGMDIMAGAAISRGPRNILAHTYFAIPISITVEGANILTRTFIIFGQGVMRCHPYLMNEISALQENNIKKFDENFYRHISHVIQNFTRYIILSITRGFFSLPTALSPNGNHWRKIAWQSAAFSFWSDFTLGVLGGSFKLRERVSAQLSDIISWLYLLSATLNHYEQQKRSEDKILMEWSMQHGLAEIERAWKEYFTAIFSAKSFLRFPLGLIAKLMRYSIAINPLSKKMDDFKMRSLVKKITTDKKSQAHLTNGIYMPKSSTQILAQLDNTSKLILQSQKAYAIMKSKLRKKGIRLTANNLQECCKKAVAENIISAKQAAEIQTADKARKSAIEVDVFTLSDYLKHSEKTGKLF